MTVGTSSAASSPSFSRAYGWRARFGMLKPTPVCSTNSHEFYMVAPEGVELFVTSLGVAGPSRSEYAKAIEAIDGPLDELLEHSPHVIVQAGVPLIATREAGFETTLRARVAKRTAVPFITDVGASIGALQLLGCSRIAMLSGAFSDDLVKDVGAMLGREGIELLSARRVLDGGRAGDVALLPLEAVYHSAKRLHAESSGADGLWITHAAMPSLGVLEQLEQELGVPVVSSAQALMWGGLRAAGITEPISGFGQLLRRPDGLGV